MPRAVVTDVDGTMFDSSHRLLPCTECMYGKLSQNNIPVIPCTGRCRNSVVTLLRSALKHAVVEDAKKEEIDEEEIESRVDARQRAMGFFSSPGVYLNGLIAYGKDDKVVHETRLDIDTCLKVLQFVKSFNDPSVVLCIYQGDDIYVEDETGEAERLFEFWRESPPQHVEDLAAFVRTTGRVNSLGIESRHASVIERLKLQIEDFMSSDEGCVENAILTQPNTALLFVMPLGFSKAEGLQRVFASLEICPQDVLAIGDGENDLEMLQYVGVSVAMGNAVEAVKKVALHVTKSNAEGGWAAAMRQHVLQVN